MPRRDPTLPGHLLRVLVTRRGGWTKKPICDLRRVPLNFASHPEAAYDLVGLRIDEVGAIKIIELFPRGRTVHNMTKNLAKVLRAVGVIGCLGAATPSFAHSVYFGLASGWPHQHYRPPFAWNGVYNHRYGPFHRYPYWGHRYCGPCWY